MTFDELIDLVTQAGFAVQSKKSDENFRRFKSNGISCLIIPTIGNDRNVQSVKLFAGFSIESADVPDYKNKSNTWNAKYRFAKCYITGNNIAFEMDIVVMGSLSASQVDEMMRIWSRLLIEIPRHFASDE